MSKLLKLEMRKLLRQTSFYVCAAIVLGSLLLSGLTAWLLTEGIEELQALFGYDAVTYTVSGLSNGSFEILVGIFIALNVCLDHSHLTVRTICGRGYSRTGIYFSKLISVIIGVVVMFLLCTVGAFATGCIFFEMGTVDSHFIHIMLAQLVTSVALGLLFFALCILIRKSGLAITAVILAPIVVSLVLALLDTALPFEEFSITEYWLGTFTGSLSVASVSAERISQCMIVSACYIPVLTFLPLWLYRKIDL